MKTNNILSALSQSLLFYMAAATPTTLPKSGAVQSVQQSVQGHDLEHLKAAPSTIPADVKALLGKYQHYSDSAAHYVRDDAADYHPSSGYCYKEYPCFSVDRVAVTSFGTQNSLTPEKISGLIDQISAQSTVVFSQDNRDSIVAGYKIQSDGLVLDVIGQPGQTSSDVLAGSIMDLFKARGNIIGSNAIRGAQAPTSGTDHTTTAICLYPAGIDSAAARNFCIGKDLTGTISKLGRRGVLGNLVGTACGIIDIPIVCPVLEGATGSTPPAEAPAAPAPAVPTPAAPAPASPPVSPPANDSDSGSDDSDSGSDDSGSDDDDSGSDDEDSGSDNEDSGSDNEGSGSSDSGSNDSEDSGSSGSDEPDSGSGDEGSSSNGNTSPGNDSNDSNDSGSSTTPSAGTAAPTPSPSQAPVAAPAQPSLTCTSKVVASPGKYCYDLAQAAGISLQAFYALNPSVGSSCQTLIEGNSYCV